MSETGPEQRSEIPNNETPADITEKISDAEAAKFVDLREFYPEEVSDLVPYLHTGDKIVEVKLVDLSDYVSNRNPSALKTLELILKHPWRHAVTHQKNEFEDKIFRQIHKNEPT